MPLVSAVSPSPWLACDNMFWLVCNQRLVDRYNWQKTALSEVPCL